MELVIVVLSCIMTATFIGMISNTSRSMELRKKIEALEKQLALYGVFAEKQGILNVEIGKVLAQQSNINNDIDKKISTFKNMVH